MKRIFLFLIVLFIANVSFPGDFFYDDQQQEYELITGEVMTLPVYNPTRVSVIDPEVLEVVKVSEKGIDIAGRNPGTTRLDIWTVSGKESFTINVFGKDLSDIKEKLSNVLYKQLKLNMVKLSIDKLNGKVVLTGELNDEQFKQVDSLISGYSSYISNMILPKKERDLVKIDVNILEVAKTNAESLGFNWQDYLYVREEPYGEPSASTATNSSSRGSSSSSNSIVTSLNRIGKGALFTKISGFSRDALYSRINMMIRNNQGKVLSQPKVVCLSGEEAKISVGGEVPVVTTTTGESGTATNVEYKEYGVILKIRPIVMENDMVKINLYTEVSDIDWINAVTASGISIPAFSKREASTELFIKTGETVFIGGLIKSDKSKDVEKIPAIGNIPVLGALFRSKDFQNDKTELVISLTPDIIKYGEDPILKEETDGYKVITGDPNTQPSNDLRKYIWNIQRKIISSLIYPPSAEEQAVQGEIKLSLHLFSDGTLSGVRVIQSSGHRVLDDTVIDTVKRLSPYEPFPSSMEEKEVWIEVPIVYSLN